MIRIHNKHFVQGYERFSIATHACFSQKVTITDESSEDIAFYLKFVVSPMQMERYNGSNQTG